MRWFAILLFCACALAQDSKPDPKTIENYAPYSIALLPDGPNQQIIIPFMDSENHIVFYPLPEVVKASQEKRVLGKMVTYGQLIALIGDLQIQLTQAKQENEKLWAVVSKNSPPAQVTVVQPVSNPRSDAMTRYILLRQLFPAPPQTVNVNVTNCTAYPALCVH